MSEVNQQQINSENNQIFDNKIKKLVNLSSFGEVVTGILSFVAAFGIGYLALVYFAFGNLFFKLGDTSETATSNFVSFVIVGILFVLFALFTITLSILMFSQAKNGFKIKNQPEKFFEQQNKTKRYATVYIVAACLWIIFSIFIITQMNWIIITLSLIVTVFYILLAVVKSLIAFDKKHLYSNKTND